jgi:hypothetical protein
MRNASLTAEQAEEILNAPVVTLRRTLERNARLTYPATSFMRVWTTRRVPESGRVLRRPAAKNARSQPVARDAATRAALEACTCTSFCHSLPETKP